MLYKIPKTIRIRTAEPKWRCGVWVGSIESSDERLVGTSRGVVKCRATTALPDTQSFRADAINAMRGVPWKPPGLHACTCIRTHIPEEDEEDYEGDMDNNDIQIQHDNDELQDDRIKHAKEAQHIIQNHIGQSYSFCVRARDIVGTHAHAGMSRVQVCDGSGQHLVRPLAEVKGPDAESHGGVQARPPQSQEVVHEKGIDAAKEEQGASMSAQDDLGRKRQPDHAAGATAKSQMGLSNPSSGSGLVRDRAVDGGGDEGHARRARRNQAKDKRREGELQPDEIRGIPWNPSTSQECQRTVKN